MTLTVYLSLGEQDPRFDGHRARKHLERRLAFSATSAAAPKVSEHFDAWAARHDGVIRVKQPAKVLLPPSWYASL